MHVISIESEAEFRALSEEWAQLLAQCPGRHFFHDFAWMWLSWERVARTQGRKLLVITVRDESKLVALLPLTTSGRVGMFLHADIFEYRDLHLLPGVEAARVCELIRDFLKQDRQVDLLHLRNVRLPSYIEDLVGPDLDSYSRHESRSAVIRLDRFDSWEDYSATLSKKLMADQRRQWRRIRERFPGLECRLLTQPEKVHASIGWMMAEKAKWLHQKRKLPPMASVSSGRRDLYQEAALMALEKDQLLMMEIRDGEQRLSAGFGFVYEGEYTFEMFAYSLEHETFSPSRLLLELLIRECLDRGIRSFDFLPGGGSPYKALWATDFMPSASYIMPLNLRGTLRTLAHRYLDIALHRPPGLQYYLPRPVLSFLRRALSR